MGLSSNQARFLSLTSRQIDLEHRIQQICQRRLRLTSELENVSTAYNRSISNRKMFVPSSGQLQALSIDSLKSVGYKVINTDTQRLIGTRPPSVPPPNPIEITSQAQFLQIVNDMNSSGVGLDKNYILQCDIDLSSYNTGGKALIQGAFTGNFDGNCYQIKNLSINNTDPSTNPTGSYYGAGNGDPGVGMFERISGGSVANLELTDVNINVNGNVYRAGALAGSIVNGAQVSNVSVSDTTISGSTDSKGLGGLVGVIDGATTVISACTVDADVSGAWSIGGLAGLMSGGTLEKSESYGTVAVNQATMRTPDGHQGDRMAGGLVAAVQGGTVTQCYSDATVSNIAGYAGGITGIVGGAGVVISNTYATGNVSGASAVGGFSGDIRDGAIVTNSYSQNTLTSGGNQGGFYGANSMSPPNSVSNSFYDSSMYGGGFGPAANAGTWTNVAGISTSDIDANAGAFPTVTAGWDTTNIWDTSAGAPTLRNVGYSAFGVNVDENLRSGKYTLIQEADEFTQDPITIDGEKYEQIDWRATPEIFDELYKGDDVDAENKYDKTINEINAQDKKLQLEQTTVEVEYKAISSERESVKKILENNAQNSFKYFS